MMTTIMVTGMVILMALALLVVVFGYVISTVSVKIRRQTLEEARKWQEEHYDLSWYDGLEKEDYTVTGWEDYVLHVQHLKNPSGAERLILISHGYSDNRFGALKYAKMYLDLGFDVIVYDLRGHGANAKTFCTYSIREARDLDALIRDCRTRCPEMKVFGIHGESLGAATSVACLKYEPEIDFVVSDCAFSDITEVFKHMMHGLHLSEKLVDTASIFDKIWYGYSLDEMRPIEGLEKNKIPILFLHGEEDDFVLPEHSEKLCAATGGTGELHLIPGAGHAESVLKEPELYREYVEGFLRKTGAL